MRADSAGMESPRLHFFAAWLVVAGGASAASFEDRVEALFRPPLGETIALSPDGRRVAYTQARDGELSLVIVDIEPPGARRTVKVDPERNASAVGSQLAALRFLRWATSRRLVYAPAERIVPLPPLTDASGRTTPNPDGPTVVAPILLVDVDGRERGTLVDARDFQETPESARRSLADLLRTPEQLAQAHHGPVGWRMPHVDVLGFLPNDRQQMVVQTRGAYSMPRQYLVGLEGGDVREFGGEWPVPPGEPQVFDGFRLKTVGERVAAARPATAWRDDDLGRAQRELEVEFPRRVVELLDWSETRTRLLFRVTGGSDAGRIFVWHRPEDVVCEILKRAPWLDAAKLNPTRFFECEAPGGAKLSGYLTWPAKPASEPPPLLVVFPTGFPGHAQPVFDPEAQVFADLGCAVVRLNHRSVAGVAPKDLTALRAAVDRVSAEDARTVLAWLATQEPARSFDRARVVALGHGFGGYLAVRAAQLAPQAFHGAIALDAPLDLRAWLKTPGVTEVPVALIDHAGADWRRLSALEAVAATPAPVLLLTEPGRNAAVDAAATAWRARADALGRPADTAELEPGFAAAQPVARVAGYRRIAEFLRAPPHEAGADGAAAKEEP